MNDVALRILLMHPEGISRTVLALLLQDQSGLQVVGTTRDPAGTVAEAERLQPDVALLGIARPCAHNRLIAQVRSVAPAARVLVFAHDEGPACVRAALDAGALGYLVRRSSCADLFRAIGVVARGGTFVEPTLAAALLPRADVHGSELPRVLNPIELRVLRLLVEGHTSEDIAAAIHRSTKAVDLYRARISEKLGVRSRAELFRAAVDGGLFAPGADTGCSGAGCEVAKTPVAGKTTF